MKSPERKNVRYLVSLMVVLLVVAGASSYRAEAQQANLPAEVINFADMIFFNGKILTADDNFNIVEAVAIRDGKFLAVGKTNKIVTMAGPKTRKIDLKGKTVMPGILDIHQHPISMGMLAYWKSRDNIQWEGQLPTMTPLEREVVVEWKDANSALRDIEKAAKAAKPGEVVVIPTRVNSLAINLCDALRLEEIDAVTGNTPVFFVELVNIAGYGANSKAAALLELPPGTPRFRSDGSACLGPRNPLGFVEATAATKAIDDYLFWRVPLEEQMPAYRLGSQRASAHGITLVKEHSSLQLLTGIRELWARGELTVRMRMPFPLYPDSGTFEVTVPKDKAEALFKRMGNVSGIGDDMWRFEGVRPGAIGGPVMQGTMWTIDAKVRSLPGKPNLPYGMNQPTSDETFPGREAVVQAVRYGWDVSGDHTVGDRSVLEYLKAIEEGLKTQVVKRPNQRFTIAHTPMARPEEIQKMKELGIMPSIGLWHLFFPPMADSAVYQYGEGVQKIAPVKSYIKMGIKPALEGDSFDYTPFWRMGVAITRKDYKGRIFNASEKITRQEALWMSTNWPAYHIGEEKKLGTIEPGKLADLVVVDGDYMNVPEDDISKIDALMTVVGGKVVYEAAGALK